jgi:hypothetical protein
MIEELRGKASNRRVIAFVRLPRPGHVKTRLAAVVGAENACAVYRAFVADLMETLRASGVPHVFAYATPEKKTAVMKWLGKKHSFISQRGRDVGERMENAFRDIFSMGVEVAVLIGSDVPDLSPVRIREAFRMLMDWDAVIGPACDGGYYLIGFRREAFLPDVFRSIRWGTETVFRDTMEVFSARGTPVGVVGCERDVDRAEDLWDLWQRHEGCGLRARHTRSLLRSREGLLEVLRSFSER